MKNKDYIYYIGERAHLFDFTLGLFQNYDQQAKFILSQLRERQLLDPSVSILELGCGSGMLISLLTDRLGDSANIIGIDISSEMVDMAKVRCGSKKVKFYVKDATQFLRDCKSTFDCIIFLFNFIQGFSNFRQAFTFLSLVRERLSTNGIAVFDWHNEPVFERLHPQGIRTRLEMPFRLGKGKTICYISSYYYGVEKEMSCYFKVQPQGAGVANLITRHRLHTFNSRVMKWILTRSGLNTTLEVEDYAGSRFYENSSERCISIVQAMRDPKRLEEMVKQLFIDAGACPVSLGIVGSYKDTFARPDWGDIDLLVILP